MQIHSVYDPWSADIEASLEKNGQRSQAYKNTLATDEAKYAPQIRTIFSSSYATYQQLGAAANATQTLEYRACTKIFENSASGGYINYRELLIVANELSFLVAKAGQ